MAASERSPEKILFIEKVLALSTIRARLHETRNELKPV